jgi:hypothetical protein
VLLILSAGLWWAVIARLRTIRMRRATVRRVVLALVGFTVVLLVPGTVLLTLGLSSLLGAEASRALLVALIAAWLVDLTLLGALCWRQRDDWGQVGVLSVAAYGVLCVVLGFVVARAGEAGAWVRWAAALSFASTWIALLAWAVGFWLQRRRALAAGAVLLVLLAVAAAVLAGTLFANSLAFQVADPRAYLGPAGWLSGCAPARPEATVGVTLEVEKEQAVQETVAATEAAVVEKEVEKEVIVTRVVEVEKEVTKIVSGTPILQPTATPVAADGVTATLAPTRAPAEAPATPPTPSASTPLALEPGQELVLPTAPPTARPAAPLPLLDQVAAETIYWVPEAITDGQGRLAVDVPLPEVPATWRMTVLASTRSGELGQATALLPVD